MSMSKIIKLEVENVKRVNAVMIEPKDGVTVIGGRNGQGKSSVIDSIEYALGGKPDASRPIRDGSSKARVVVETDDLIVTRHFTASGSRLEVTGKDGRAYKSPQAMLDKLVGKLSFDPLGFSRMQPKEQAETLRGLIGVDFSEIDAERKTLFDQRTDINREAKSLAAQVESMARHSDVPEQEVSVSELTAEYERVVSANSSNADERNKLETLISREEELGKTVSDTEEKILALQDLLKAQISAHEESVSSMTKQQHVVSLLRDVDTQEMRDKIKNAESVNAKVRENARRKELECAQKSRSDDANKITERLEEIDRTKENILSDSKFPVDGLAFDDDGVTFCGIPFAQCSSAEQLRVSVAMGLAMNPELLLLLIRDGSLLDSESLAMVADMAEKADAQIIIERVGEGSECSVIIEDGMLKKKEGE